MTTLYERKILDRHKAESDEFEGSGRKTVYTLSDYGRELIEEKGTATQEDWLAQA